MLDVGNVTSDTVTTLTNGQDYRFQVIALNNLGAGQPSDEQLATPSAEP